MIRMSREIRSLILIMILLCVSIAAIELKSKSTVHNGNAVTVSSGSSSFTSGTLQLLPRNPQV